MAMVQGVASTSNSIEFMISGLTYPDYQYSNFRMELWTENGALVETKNFTSDTSQMFVSKTFTGLPSGRFYTIKAWIRYLQDPQEYVGSSVYATQSGGGNPQPTLPGAVGTVTAIPSTQTEGKLFVSWGAASNALYYNITLYKADGTYVKDETTILYETEFTGLTPDLYYYVVVVPWNGEGRGASGSSGNVLVPKFAVRPNNWQWISTVELGSNITMPASEWNSFFNRINAFRVNYKGLSNYTYTEAVVGGSITAAQYNQARSAISTMGAVPPAVTIGNQIYASEFNAIRDALNAIT